MRGASRRLFRQYGSHELAITVKVERACDLNQDIIGGTELYGSAPYDAASFPLYDTSHRRKIEINRRNGLHGIGCPGWRRDRARRSLRDGQSKCRNDGNDDHAGSVAR